MQLFGEYNYSRSSGPESLSTVACTKWGAVLHLQGVSWSLPDNEHEEVKFVSSFRQYSESCGFAFRLYSECINLTRSTVLFQCHCWYRMIDGLLAAELPAPQNLLQSLIKVFAFESTCSNCYFWSFLQHSTDLLINYTDLLTKFDRQTSPDVNKWIRSQCHKILTSNRLRASPTRILCPVKCALKFFKLDGVEGGFPLKFAEDISKVFFLAPKFKLLLTAFPLFMRRDYNIINFLALKIWWKFRSRKYNTIENKYTINNS